jgi:hypothetical protein
MKFTVIEEFVFGTTLVKPGDIIEGCSTRMVELGLVTPFTEFVAKAPKVKPKQEILTEVSSPVEVQIEEDEE